MKKRQNISIFSGLIIGVFLVFASSCEKDDDIELNGKTTAVFNPDVTYGTMTDLEGNVYKTVTIGTQTWMAENLRTTKYEDGTAIPNVTDGNKWRGLTTGAYCNYNTTSSIDTIATYGRLYNWYTVETGKLAPEGWHVPTDDEWRTLIDYLGGKDVAGGKLKEFGTTHWSSPNEGATNETGFTALSGGYRGDSEGKFFNSGNIGSWWSSTEYNSNFANECTLWYPESGIQCYTGNKSDGRSVRCIKDNE